MVDLKDSGRTPLKLLILFASSWVSAIRHMLSDLVSRGIAALLGIGILLALYPTFAFSNFTYFFFPASVILVVGGHIRMPKIRPSTGCEILFR